MMIPTKASSAGSIDASSLASRPIEVITATSKDETLPSVDRHDNVHRSPAELNKHNTSSHSLIQSLSDESSSSIPSVKDIVLSIEEALHKTTRTPMPKKP